MKIETLRLVAWLVCVCTCAHSLAGEGQKLPIEGQVVDYMARPVHDAEVVVCERYPVAGLDCNAKSISPVARTDANGRFAIKADAAQQRDVFIVARKPGLACAWDWLNSGSNTFAKKHFPLVLEPASVLAGQVVNSDGRPVAGAEVQATPVTTCGFSGVVDRWEILGPRQWFTVTTDSQGRFRFEQLAADVTVHFRIQAPGWDSVYEVRPHESANSGYEAGRTDVRLALPREGAIRGRVVGPPGRPVGTVDVMLQSAREGDSTNLYVARKTTSQATGTFSFEGVPEGPHWVGVVVPGQEPQLWTGKEVKVSVEGGQVSETTVRVEKGCILEVKAINARTGRPLDGANLSAYGQGCKLGWSGVADATGVARVRVPPGDYSVFVSGREFFKFSSWQGTARVAHGQVVREQVLLTPAPSVSGRVVGPDGQTVADVAVTIHPHGDHVYTDAQGRFDAGCSKLVGTRGVLVLARDAASGLAAAVSVDDLSKPVELKLNPAWTLSGKITDPNGTGIPSARLSLHLSTMGCLSSSGVEVLTDREGGFEAKAIPPSQSGFEYCICINVAGYGPQKYEKIYPKGEPGASVDLGMIRLPPANASASGVVVDATGAPTARILVLVNSLPGLEQPRRLAVTNEKGEFTINRACTGPARLQAYAGDPDGGFLVADLPAHGVKIVLGKELTHTPETSILNKPLPALTGLGEAMSQVRTDGRMMLVCFWDMNQRPSRYCLTQLAGQAETLKAKGVVVVAVQASKVEQNALDEYVKKYNVPFSVGMVQGDAEKARFAWGVKSLPWLILTDRRHVVSSAGFGLNELEARIKAVKD